MKLTITKLFANIPFGHRQFSHDGHCKFVHGHDWSFAVTFGCIHLDKDGFIIDFGKMQFIKEYIARYLDHALLISEKDPELEVFKALDRSKLAKLTIVPDCSAEGLAVHLQHEWNLLTIKATEGRAFIKGVQVFEDSKNSATYDDGI